MAAEAVIFFDPATWREHAGPAQAWRRHLASKHRFIAAQMEAFCGDDLWLKLGRHANAMADALAGLTGGRLQAGMAGRGERGVRADAARIDAAAQGRRRHLLPMDVAEPAKGSSPIRDADAVRHPGSRRPRTTSRSFRHDRACNGEHRLGRAQAPPDSSRLRTRLQTCVRAPRACVDRVEFARDGSACGDDRRDRSDGGGRSRFRDRSCDCASIRSGIGAQRGSMSSVQWTTTAALRVSFECAALAGHLPSRPRARRARAHLPPATRPGGTGIRGRLARPAPRWVVRPAAARCRRRARPRRAPRRNRPPLPQRPPAAQASREPPRRPAGRSKPVTPPPLNTPAGTRRRPPKPRSRALTPVAPLE